MSATQNRSPSNGTACIAVHRRPVLWRPSFYECKCHKHVTHGGCLNIHDVNGWRTDPKFTCARNLAILLYDLPASIENIGSRVQQSLRKISKTGKSFRPEVPVLKSPSITSSCNCIKICRNSTLLISWDIMRGAADRRTDTSLRQQDCIRSLMQ